VPTDGRQSCVCVFLQKANWAGSTGLGTPYTSPFGRAPCVASTTTDGSDGPGLVPLYFCFFSPDETYAAGCCYPFGLPSSSIIFVCSSSTAAVQVDPIQCVVCNCASWILAALCSIDHTSALKITMLHHFSTTY
jgi:hypothetical protein